MLFLVIAKDGTDSQAPARRQAVRDEHLSNIKPSVEAGILHVGGAIMDDDGNMIGSALIAEAESKEDLQEFLDSDIYTKTGVWQSFEIYPFKRAV